MPWEIILLAFFAGGVLGFLGCVIVRDYYPNFTHWSWCERCWDWHGKSHPHWEPILIKARLSPDRKLVEGLMAVRDALVGNDPEEAYHQLYQLADRGRNSLTPWDEWEAALKTQEPAKP
jgi:hypothetical protein